MKNKLFILIIFISLCEAHSQNGRCYSYDAAGNRIKREQCIISMTNVEWHHLNDLLLKADPSITQVGSALSNNKLTKDNSGDLTDIIIYPNPSSGLIHLENQEQWLGSKLSIITLEGKQIHSQVIDSNPLDLNTFANGQYFIILENKSRLKSAKLLIIK